MQPTFYVIIVQKASIENAADFICTPQIQSKPTKKKQPRIARMCDKPSSSDIPLTLCNLIG